MKHILNILQILLLGSLGLAGICQGATQTAITDWNILLKYEGKEIRQLEPSAKTEMETAVSHITTDAEFSNLIHPVLFTKLLNAQHQYMYVLLNIRYQVCQPSPTYFQEFDFDNTGKMRYCYSYVCGWETLVGEVKPMFIKEIYRKGIRVERFNDPYKSNTTFQYYALVQNRLLLIREEDDKGHIVRNALGVRLFTHGAVLNHRTPENWERALKSSDPAEVLATLVWLGGAHLDPKKPGATSYHENSQEAKLAKTVWFREGVLVTLQSLTHSKNPWILEATQMTIDREYFHK